MSLENLNLLAHLGSTLYMVGLIWFVQRVHYPLFSGVGPDGFAAYAQEHVERTGPVVGPAMLIEAGTALVLCVAPPAGVGLGARLLGVALLAVVWLSTWGLQVPRHRDLAAGFDASPHRRLVGTNWIRTVAWSARGLLVLWMTARSLASTAP